MTSEGRGILSPVRLPVPPLQQLYGSFEFSAGSEHAHCNGSCNGCHGNYLTLRSRAACWRLRCFAYSSRRSDDSSLSSNTNASQICRIRSRQVDLAGTSPFLCTRQNAGLPPAPVLSPPICGTRLRSATPRNSKGRRFWCSRIGRLFGRQTCVRMLMNRMKPGVESAVLPSGARWTRPRPD